LIWFLSIGGWLYAQPANDQCSGAIPLTTGVPFTMNTTDATDGGDPLPACGPSFGGGVWFTFTPASNGFVLVSTCASTFDTVLQVYSGDCNALTPVSGACQPFYYGCAGSQAPLLVLGSAGTTYWILAGGYFRARGTLSIMADLGPPLANDQCSGAIALAAGVPFVMSTTNATDTGDPVPTPSRDSRGEDEERPRVSTVTTESTPTLGSAAPAGSTSAAVSAGATAQFQLQLTPGANYTGNVTFACTGAPFGAMCQAPALTIANGSVMPFTVSVTTSGAAHAQLLPLRPRVFLAGQFRMTPLLPFFAVLLGLFIAGRAFRETLAPRHRALASALAAVACISLISAAGCGGGSSQASVTPPPPVITPQGTSTLTITPSATNSAGKPLQLAPVQLTLTVN